MIAVIIKCNYFDLLPGRRFINIVIIIVIYKRREIYQSHDQRPRVQIFTKMLRTGTYMNGAFTNSVSDLYPNMRTELLSLNTNIEFCMVTE